MVVDPGARRRVIEAYVNDGEVDLDAFEALHERGNRLAVYHLQQAAEKLVRAVRIHRGLVNTKDHELAILIDGRKGEEHKPPLPLPPDDSWRERLLDFEWLSAFATTFRYPTDAGRLKDVPSREILSASKAKLVVLFSIARQELLTS